MKTVATQTANSSAHNEGMHKCENAAVSSWKGGLNPTHTGTENYFDLQGSAWKIESFIPIDVDSHILWNWHKATWILCA